MTTLSKVDKDYLVIMLEERRERLEYCMSASRRQKQMLDYIETLIEKVKHAETEEEQKED